MSHLRHHLPAGLHAQLAMGHHCLAAPCSAPQGLGIMSLQASSSSHLETSPRKGEPECWKIQTNQICPGLPEPGMVWVYMGSVAGTGAGNEEQENHPFLLNHFGWKCRPCSVLRPKP